jgi:hypothetical protein
MPRFDYPERTGDEVDIDKMKHGEKKASGIYPASLDPGSNGEVLPHKIAQTPLRLAGAHHVLSGG